MSTDQPLYAEKMQLDLFIWIMGRMICTLAAQKCKIESKCRFIQISLCLFFFFNVVTFTVQQRDREMLEVGGNRTKNQLLKYFIHFKK